MNFNICEDALTRILEILANYDFTIELRPASSHQNADSLSLRPCIDQECAHCERFEKKYSENTPGLATRKTGVTSEESVKQGECQTNVKSYESSTEKLGAPSPSKDSTEKKGMCLEQGPLLTHSRLNDTECLLNGRIRQNTTPNLEGPQTECKNLLLENETHSL